MTPHQFGLHVQPLARLSHLLCVSATLKRIAKQLFWVAEDIPGLYSSLILALTVLSFTCDHDIFLTFTQKTPITFTFFFMKRNRILTKKKKKQTLRANRRLLRRLLDVMRAVFTLPASIFCSADRRDSGRDILEDTSIVDVKDSMAAFANFKADNSLHSWRLVTRLDTFFFNSATGTWIIVTRATRRDTALIWEQQYVHEASYNGRSITTSLFFMSSAQFSFTFQLRFLPNRANQWRRALPEWFYETVFSVFYNQRVASALLIIGYIFSEKEI